jgi:hypothetical protein
MSEMSPLAPVGLFFIYQEQGYRTVSSGTEEYNHISNHVKALEGLMTYKWDGITIL